MASISSSVFVDFGIGTKGILVTAYGVGGLGGSVVRFREDADARWVGIR